MFLPTFMTSEHPKNAPPTGCHVFQANATIFELIQDNIGTNHLTKFHDDRTINVASRVLTRKNAPPPGYHEKSSDQEAIYSHIRKNAPPLGSHVFEANVTIFEHIQDIIKSNLLTIFHEDWTINVASRVLTRKTAPPHGGHCHDDGAKIVISRVFTRNTAPPPGGHVFQRTETFFELNQHII
ncbi:hypothetical protein DPMN_007191 [Dreissena polymorpha]|uniref:Uncharacterized protein n=1 Tax=Dreissena polymorpha TaxID=45954 RepID=A0A9D4MSV1_DREPO|nr:hypothetical protein DPMN_007191 [Dreissena polymorpha]